MNSHNRNERIHSTLFSLSKQIIPTLTKVENVFLDNNIPKQVLIM